MWKEIDNLLSDTVAKSSGSISNIDVAEENPVLEQIINYIGSRNNANNSNNYPPKSNNDNRNFTKKPFSKPTYAAAVKGEPTQSRPNQRVGDRPFPTHDDKTTWRFPDRDGFCYFHQRFGRDATKCRDDCKWDPNYRPKGFLNRNPMQNNNTTTTTTTKAESKPADKAPLNA